MTALPGIARRVLLRADGVSGFVLDGWGGIHPFGGAPVRTGTVYWPGWDIARGMVLRADGVSGWVLDGFGATHPFGGAPVLTGGGVHPGHAVVVDMNGASGTDHVATVDVYGGVKAL